MRAAVRLWGQLPIVQDQIGVREIQNIYREIQNLVGSKIDDSSWGQLPIVQD